MQKNYYELIGLTPSATQNEIDDVCITLAKKYHPEKTVGDINAKVKFHEIEEAYETLGNPEKRAKYNIALNESIPVPTTHNIEMPNSIAVNKPYKKLSTSLVLGVVFLPLIFVWILLDKSYSKNSRVIGFAWAAYCLLTIFLMCYLTLPDINRKPDVTSTATVKKTISTEPTLSDVEDSCFFAGKSLAVVYLANFDAAVDVGLQATTVMSEGCTKKMDEQSKYSMHCYNACEDGFRYATKSVLNK